LSSNQLKEAIEVINSDLVIPPHTNHIGTIFGGRVLELMDLTGAMAAMRFSGEDVVTVSMDAVDFKEPIQLGDIIELKSKVIQTGKTSLVVKADIYRAGKEGRQRNFTCRGYLVIVAISQEGTPIEIPKVKVVTEEDKKFGAIGEKIKQRAKERRIRDAQE